MVATSAAVPRVTQTVSICTLKHSSNSPNVFTSAIDGSGQREEEGPGLMLVNGQLFYSIFLYTDIPHPLASPSLAIGTGTMMAVHPLLRSLTACYVTLNFQLKFHMVENLLLNHVYYARPILVHYVAKLLQFSAS